MKERDEAQKSPNRDRHLDTPAEANTEKHINFLDTENKHSSNRWSRDEEKVTEERQKQWREGLEEGKRANRK